MAFLADNDLHISWCYVSILILLHLKSESIGRTVEAKIVATSQHENVFGHTATFGTSLWIFLGVHFLILWVLSYNKS